MPGGLENPDHRDGPAIIEHRPRPFSTAFRKSLLHRVFFLDLGKDIL